MTRDQLLVQFHDAMLGIYEAAKRLKPPYTPNDFRRMVLEMGGKGAADKLLAMGNPSEGFGTLLLRGKDALKLSVEYVVLQSPWRDLFEPEQLAVARKRLIEVKCDLPPEDSDAVTTPAPETEVTGAGLAFARRAFGGLLKHYYRAAARAVAIRISLLVALPGGPGLPARRSPCRPARALAYSRNRHTPPHPSRGPTIATSAAAGWNNRLVHDFQRTEFLHITAADRYRASGVAPGDMLRPPPLSLDRVSSFFQE